MARRAAGARALSGGAALTGVVTASTGNHGAATAWAAASLGLTATVFVPESASRTKLAHLARLGGEVVETGADLDEAKEQAVAYAAGMGLPFFEDGAEPAQLDGYAAIGEEIVEQLGDAQAAASWCPSATARCSPAWAARSESARRTRGGSASSRPVRR